MESLKAISQPKSLAKIAYAKLRSAILNGELRAGELYNEIAIAKQMGISRTPVRESLLELTSKGLVTFLPRRGVIIRSLSEEDLEELFELRAVLENHFFVKISASPSNFDFSNLEKYIREQKNAALKSNVPGYLRANGAFHGSMAEMCGNKRMVEIYGTIADLIRLLALQSMKNPMRMNDRLIPQHEAMLKALKSGDTSLATALLTIHLKESKQAALEGIKSTQDIDLNNVLSIS